MHRTCRRAALFPCRQRAFDLILPQHAEHVNNERFTENYHRDMRGGSRIRHVLFVVVLLCKTVLAGCDPPIGTQPTSATSTQVLPIIAPTAALTGLRPTRICSRVIPLRRAWLPPLESCTTMPSTGSPNLCPTISCITGGGVRPRCRRLRPHTPVPAPCTLWNTLQSPAPCFGVVPSLFGRWHRVREYPRVALACCPNSYGHPSQDPLA